MTPKEQITETLTLAFFPSLDANTRQNLGIVARQKFHSAFLDEASRLIQRTGYCRQPEDRGTLKDLAGEKRLKMFAGTLTWLQNSFDYWLGGMDNDVLAEFPAQRLICVIPEAADAPGLAPLWNMGGGKFYGGEMISLKWDQVWFKISAFNLPFPPFQLDSGYDVEDVDRGEAEALGFKIPRAFTATVQINLDTVDLRRQFSNAIQQLESL